MYKDSRSKWVLIVLVIAGAIIGSIVATTFSNTVPILKASQSIGFSTTTFNLSIIQLTCGLKLNLNLGAAAGIVLAWFAYKRM
ncbi:MAG TPA: DUF4321 domain-containing protein [Bacillota bacterium]|nr:DUF4321 domain-containing protein [Bacillota bacterium]